MHHHRTSGWFLSFAAAAYPIPWRDAKCTRAATRAATHVACRVTTNLAAYVSAESKGGLSYAKYLVVSHAKLHGNLVPVPRARENPPRRSQ